MIRRRKTCKNCGALKALHKIGRDCNARVGGDPTVCGWIDGHCRNNLKVKIVS